MFVNLAQFLGFAAAFLLLVISIFVTMGYFGGRKLAPPLSFYTLSRELDFDGLVMLSTAVAKKEVKAWNQFIFGPPYIVAEQVFGNEAKYSYIAVPRGFESDFQGYLLLRGIKFSKVDDPAPIEAESILVSDFSFRGLNGFEKLSAVVSPAAASKYGGAVVQLVMRGEKDGGFQLNSRFATFGDDYEARRLFYAISKNPRAKFGSKKLEEAVSLRLFREKNAEEF